MKEEKTLSRSHSLGAKTLFAALSYIKSRGGSVASTEVFEAVKNNVKFDHWAEEVYESNGLPRWKALLHFFSIDAVKSGFLLKKKGVWHLTTEGEAALSHGELSLFKAAHAGYKRWEATRADEETNDEAEPISEVSELSKFNLEKAEELALSGIQNAIQQKNAYDFQDMVAALLRAMGYFTPFVAPKGKDGGVDIVAYRDPLGALAPRVKVQVKHRNQAVSVAEIREIMGLLSKDGDSGLFVSTGGFSADSKAAVRNSHVHVELVDLERFIELWIEFFGKMPDEDQQLLPLVPVYFPA